MAILAACVAAAASTDVVLVTATVAHGLASGSIRWRGLAFIFAFFSFPVALFIALAIGTPVVLLRRADGRHRRRAAAWSGFLIGALLPLIVWASAGPPRGEPTISAPGLAGVIGCAAFAGLAAGIAWDIVLTALERPPARCSC